MRQQNSFGVRSVEKLLEAVLREPQQRFTRRSWSQSNAVESFLETSKMVSRRYDTCEHADHFAGMRKMVPRRSTTPKRAGCERRAITRRCVVPEEQSRIAQPFEAEAMSNWERWSLTQR